MNVKFQTRQIVTHQHFEKLLCASFLPRIKCGVDSGGNPVEKTGFWVQSGMTNKVKGLSTQYTIRR